MAGTTQAFFVVTHLLTANQNWPSTNFVVGVYFAKKNLGGKACPTQSGTFYSGSFRFPRGGNEKAGAGSCCSRHPGHQHPVGRAKLPLLLPLFRSPMTAAFARALIDFDDRAHRWLHSATRYSKTTVPRLRRRGASDADDGLSSLIGTTERRRRYRPSGGQDGSMSR